LTKCDGAWGITMSSFAIFNSGILISVICKGHSLLSKTHTFLEIYIDGVKFITYNVGEVLF